ncbi:HK97-gp10 family putative phage morphogenesis protein [Clostridium sp.]|uniref:HK97-gp10 family putative phage morphogenesis protein n=1 Tax=Clostridium sp. TaxID=1506 RepID=UPI00257D3FF8|nr:HK97-gp10 family putative phage morphogenesis protein [Clostridium sp.]MBE6056796.1 HK97 gp10 family phage protein [Clostridium sp.]
MSSNFKDNSRACKNAIKMANIKWLKAAALVIQSQAKALVPVDTSNLKTSIDHKIQVSKLEAYIGTNCDYAIYVEFGTGEFAENGQGRKGGWVYINTEGKAVFTRGMKPQPYLRPAYRANKEALRQLLNKYLREIR